MEETTPLANRIQQNKNALLDAMVKSLGNVTASCKAVGCNRSTFYEYYNNDIDFKSAVDDIENVALDFVEGKLLKQIKDENITGILFYLKCKGKKRGYIDRDIEQKQEQKDISLSITVSSNDAAKRIEDAENLIIDNIKSATT